MQILRQPCGNGRNWHLPLFAAVLIGCSDSGAVDELRAFTSDGCSSFPDGTGEERRLWRSCCVVHDLAYWKGGSKDERRAADEALKECVAKVGEPTIAKLMLAGVRVGGTPWLPTRFRWAYGWPYLRGYQEISEEEQSMVQQEVEAAATLLRDEGVVSESDRETPSGGP